MSEAGYCIYELLEKIRNRHGMYISSANLECLACFLSGYRVAMMSEGKKEASTPDFHGFHDWVRQELGYCSSVPGWSNMILASVLGLKPGEISWDTYWVGTTPDQHRESFNMFYEMLDRYRVEHT